MSPSRMIDRPLSCFSRRSSLVNLSSLIALARDDAPLSWIRNEPMSKAMKRSVTKRGGHQSILELRPSLGVTYHTILPKMT
jgi:hypothetical protein